LILYETIEDGALQRCETLGRQDPDLAAGVSARSDRRCGSARPQGAASRLLGQAGNAGHAGAERDANRVCAASARRGSHDHVPLEEGRFKATPIWYAIAHGDNLPLVKMLLKRGARADNCLYAAVWNDNADVLREILKTNPPINDLQQGEPVLISAVRWRKLKTLDVLLDAGADVSLHDARVAIRCFTPGARSCHRACWLVCRPCVRCGFGAVDVSFADSVWQACGRGLRGAGIP
jgi:uncharacterized protein